MGVSGIDRNEIFIHASRDRMRHVKRSKVLIDKSELFVEDVLGMDSALAEANDILSTPVELGLAA